jgi:hypothetical protein
MGTVSKMAQKCQKCPNKYKCNHKRTEMCAYIDEQQIAVSTGISAGAGAAAPALRETLQINAGGVMTAVYRDEIEKEIYKALREPCVLKYGA